MTKQRTDIIVCDQCKDVIGHVECDDEVLTDKEHLMVVLLADVTLGSIGQQGTFDFCNIACLRKFFSGNEYKDWLCDLDKDKGNLKLDAKNRTLN